jgi:hypothetical protein
VARLAIGLSDNSAIAHNGEDAAMGSNAFVMTNPLHRRKRPVVIHLLLSTFNLIPARRHYCKCEFRTWQELFDDQAIAELRSTNATRINKRSEMRMNDRSSSGYIGDYNDTFASPATNRLYDDGKRHGPRIQQ